MEQLTTVDRFNIAVKFLSTSQKDGEIFCTDYMKSLMVFCSGEGLTQVFGRKGE